MKLWVFFVTLALSVSAHCQPKNSLEVLHWWTSGSEARALSSLKDKMQLNGHHWQDFAVYGLAGESAINTLRIRTLSGNPPNVAQIKGPEIQTWGNAGFLTSLNDLAAEQQWDRVIPSHIASFLKVDDHYVAVPFNIHRVNWLWANPKIFEQANATLPRTLDDFFVAAEKIKTAGFIALALGNEPWQKATLFEAVALAIMGSADFKKAFIDGDSMLLSGQKMRDTLTAFRQMKQYTDPKSLGRNWNQTTALVINDEAAMQIMGDWAKGEFLAANKIENIDYICIPAPGTANQFSFNVDSFVFFKSQDPDITLSQKALATNILDPTFQQEFNLNKGSIPVRVDLEMTNFDGCAKSAMNAFLRAAATDNLVPSLSHNMAVGRASQIALFDVIARFFNNDDITIDDSIRHIRAAVLADKL